MRMIVPVVCAGVLGVAPPSRADTPAPAPPAPAQPAAVPAQPAAPAPAKVHHSRVPEITATVVTGLVVVATGASFWKWDQAHDRRRAAQWDPTISVEEHNQHMDDTLTWKRRTWVMFGTTFVSAAVTAFLWMRNQDPKSFSVQPTDDADGAAVSYNLRF